MVVEREANGSATRALGVAAGDGPAGPFEWRGLQSQEGFAAAAPRLGGANGTTAPRCCADVRVVTDAWARARAPPPGAEGPAPAPGAADTPFAWLVVTPLAESPGEDAAGEGAARGPPGAPLVLPLEPSLLAARAGWTLAGLEGVLPLHAVRHRGMVHLVGLAPRAGAAPLRRAGLELPDVIAADALWSAPLQRDAPGTPLFHPGMVAARPPQRGAFRACCWVRRAGLRRTQRGPRVSPLSPLGEGLAGLGSDWAAVDGQGLCRGRHALAR
jgi:hypothetical protein